MAFRCPLYAMPLHSLRFWQQLMPGSGGTFMPTGIKTLLWVISKWKKVAPIYRLLGSSTIVLAL